MGRQNSSRPQAARPTSPRAGTGQQRPSRPVQEPHEKQQSSQFRGRPQRPRVTQLRPARPQPDDVGLGLDAPIQEEQLVDEQFIEEPQQFKQPGHRDDLFQDSRDQGQDQFIEPEGPLVGGDLAEAPINEEQLQPLEEEVFVPQEEFIPEEPQSLPPPRSLRPANPLRSSRPQFSNARQLPLNPAPVRIPTRPQGRTSGRSPPIPGAIRVGRARQ